MELTTLPGMDKAIGWAAGVLADVQGALEHPTALVVHRGLQAQVAEYDKETASKKSFFFKFRDEAARLGRPMRFLLLEWVRLNPASRAPLFIKLFEGSKNFFTRFKGYADTICQMYVLATDCRPIELPDRLAERAQAMEDKMNEEKDKLDRLRAALVQQEKVVDELTTPWRNLDSNVLRTKPVSLPQAAGVVHPDSRPPCGQVAEQGAGHHRGGR